MANSYIKSVFEKGMGYVKGGKLGDCVAHAIDMLTVYRNYGKDNEAQLQKKMLVKMLRYANKNCEYYTEIGKTLKDPDDIYQYPFVNKTIIRENMDKIVSRNKDKMIYNTARTSGSTGNPLEFYNGNGLDDFFQRKVWEKYGYEEGDKILSMFGVKIPEEDVKNNIFWKDTPVNSSSQGGYNLSSLYLTNENISIFVDYIMKLKPDFIRAFPSFITEICQYMIKNNIEVDFKVKGIELTSETSFEWQWDLIKKVFKPEHFFFQYGHTECCMFGYSYDDTMKIRMEPLYGFVEIVDDNGEHVKEGEVGEVTVTSLHNFVMPFIRYRTGDLAEFGGYDGKYMILNKVYGRTQDHLLNKNGDKLILTAFLAEHHLKALGKIEKWQFEQFEKGKAIIHLIKAEGYDENDEKEIKDFFVKFGNLDCEFDYVDHIERAARGKSHLIVQHIKD